MTDLASLGSVPEVLNRLHNLALVHTDDRIVFINRCGAHWLGLPAETFIGTRLADVLHPDYAGLGDFGMEALAREGMIPLKFLTRSGEDIDVEMWVSALDGPGPAHFLVEARDVTVHLRAAKALQQREQRLEGIIQTVADGIVTVDHRGLIQSFNPAAEAIFGFAAEEVLGRNIRVLIPRPEAGQPSDTDEVEFLRRISGEWIGRRKDGLEIPLEIAVREMNHEGGVAFTSVVRDITARKKAEQRLRQLAHYDSLTGLPNRFLFSDRLESAVQRAERRQTRLAVAFIDLDCFKPINDTYGHQIGDEVLRLVSTRLSGDIRKTDTLARLGGDEFVAILEDAGEQESIRKIADKILTSIATPLTIGALRLTVGASVGIAVYPDDANSPEDLLFSADKAMYRAKAVEGSSLSFFSSSGGASQTK